ncbi:flagellar basal body L-ring protein FlgH [Candidatus Margulisiibacteriota bacterium]
MYDYKNLALKFFTLCMLSFYLFVTVSYSASLWTESSTSPYITPKAHKAGDVVMVIIDEKTSALQTGTTQSDRDSDIQFDLQNAFSNVNRGKETSGDDSIGINFRGANRYRGIGRTMRDSKVKTTLTATVIDVQPNGNLFIMGQRQLHINSETQQLEVSGIIRQTDITPQNTILSSQIANAKIALRGSGPVSGPQSTGLFSKLFGWLF